MVGLTHGNRRHFHLPVRHAWRAVQGGPPADRCTLAIRPSSVTLPPM
jgi:hypothetical protein